eukprot:COSAG06_NODE_6621_length_2852_cov_42.609880_1_plen_45_part_10
MPSCLHGPSACLPACLPFAIQTIHLTEGRILCLQGKAATGRLELL